MKYITHNDTPKGRRINIGGTCRQGHITCTYDKLVQLFGEPCDGDAYKVDAEWNIRFPSPEWEVSDQADDGIVCTIYNWKNGKNYCGETGEDVVNITEWNVGGHSKQALWMLMEVLDGSPAEIEKKRLQDEIAQLKKQKQTIMNIMQHERNRLVLELQSAIKIINDM